MDIKQVQKPLTQFVKNIPASIKVDQVIVFGSYLEGTARSDSDIDVIVVSDDFRGMDEDQRLKLLYQSRRFIEPEVHRWGFTSEELNQASELTTLGYARTSGIRFI